MRTLRRHWLQFAALGVVVGALVVLWVVGGRGGSSAAGGASAAASRSAAPSATTDRVEQVRQAATAYVQAVDMALQTGSITELNTLTVDGSQARGLAGRPAGIVRNSHRTFVVTGRTFTKLVAQVATTSASVVMSFDETGYDAAWPSLERAGPDHVVHQDETLGMQLTADRWLVETDH